MALVLKFTPVSTICSNITSGKFAWCLWSFHKSTRVDLIDSFTSELVEKKAAKWDRARVSVLNNKSLPPPPQVYQRIDHVAKRITRELDAIRKPELSIDIRLMSQCQLDNILSGILDEENDQDFNYIINQCITCSVLPSSDILSRCLDYLVSLPQLQKIDPLAEICEKVNENFFRDNSNLISYKSLALWRYGNAEQAIALIMEGYRLPNRNRKGLREAFRTMADETVGTKSEAVLVTITKAAEKVYQDFNETFLVACVWKNMFTSKWFSDQQMSNDLFEKHDQLRELVYRKATSIFFDLLSQHDVDTAHRLIQLFLKYDNKEACRVCLKMLFNYQYWRRDLRACSEIMQFCLDIELPLSEIETEKLLNLLLNRSNTTSRPIPKSECNKFQYKF